jgi:hypothetical protein
LERKRLQGVQTRRKFLLMRAAELWKFYTKKSKEYKADDITKQFFDYERAIILKDDPG